MALRVLAAEPEVGALERPEAAGQRVFHTVRAGETAWRIAQRYGVTLEALAQANRLEDVSRVVAGSRLVIPTAPPKESALPPVSLPPPTLMGPKLLPVDEGNADPAFSRFREELREAARTRDQDFLWSVLDPEIVSDFGQPGLGSEAFRQAWTLYNRDDVLWDELIAILSLGGAFRTGQSREIFCAPYLYTNFPPSLDPTRYGVITGQKVRLRAAPDSEAKVLGSLSHDLVEILETNPSGSGDWVEILHDSGGRGFVARRWVRRSSDYHACFRRRDGHWVIWLVSAGY